VKEYRIPLPLTLEEYKIAQRYCTVKRSLQETTDQEGVEVVKDEPFADDELGEGRYTEKIIHLGRHVPNWARAIIPKKAQMLVEKSWNAFPKCKSVYSCPFFDKFSMTIISNHSDESGDIENILTLSDKELKARKIEFIDIAFDPLEAQYYKAEEDPTQWRSEKKERGPLAKGWQKSQDPIMCCYKCVSIEFRYTGFQKKVESYMDKMLRMLMFTFSRQVVCMMDEWADKTIEDVEKLETEMQDILNKKCETIRQVENS